MSNARLVFGPNPFDLTENGDKNIGSFVDEARSREEVKFEDKDYQAFFQK